MAYAFPIATASSLGVVQAGTNISIDADGVISTAGAGTGFTGSSGFVGSVGFTGSSGFVGSVGFVGSRGFNGSAGFTGSSGFVGSAGFVGSMGYTGSSGTGFTGSSGYNGSTGFAGSTGFVGSLGYTGSSGTGGATIGTWTPAITSSALATITVVSTTASYSKIGQQVICYFDITVTVESGGSGAGAVSLSGLPFTSLASLGYVGSVIVSYFNNASAKETTITGSVVGNSTRASLWNAHEVYDITAFTQEDIQVTTRLQGTVIYLSAA